LIHCGICSAPTMPAAGNALHAIATEGLLLINPRAATAG
jgi:hypothetical protein